MKVPQKLALAFIRFKFSVLSLLSKQRAARSAFELFCTPQSRHIKKLPVGFEKADQLEFIFHQDKVAGYRWNKGGHQRLLILHGFESSVINFDHYILPLIEKGYEVVAFDAPAHGRSSGRQINALIYKDFIKELHARYGPFHSWIAHSFGGLCICLALSEMPHHEDDRIVLLAPATESTTTIQTFFDYLHIKHPAVKEGFEKIVVDVSGHPIGWFGIRRTLEKLQATILWIHDKDDLVTPFRDAEIIQKENHPNIHFVVTNGLGHRRIYRDATVSRTVIDFL
jgi:pimeloyl-ACP methyl ester carboxylesterase